MALPGKNNQLKRPINGDIWSSSKETIGSQPNHHKTSPTTCSELCSTPPSSTHGVSQGSPYSQGKPVIWKTGKRKGAEWSRETETKGEKRNFWNPWWVSLGGKRYYINETRIGCYLKKKKLREWKPALGNYEREKKNPVKVKRDSWNLQRVRHRKTKEGK